MEKAKVATEEADVFKTSISGVTYFNPLNPLYESNMSMKHTSQPGLNKISRLEENVRRRKKSIKMIELNNKNARCIFKIRSKRSMKIIFAFMLILHIAFIVISSIYFRDFIEETPILYVFIMFQFSFISISFGNRYQEVNGLKKTSIKKTLFPFVIIVATVFTIGQTKSVLWHQQKNIDLNMKHNLEDRKGCVVIDKKMRAKLMSKCLPQEAPFAIMPRKNISIMKTDMLMSQLYERIHYIPGFSDGDSKCLDYSLPYLCWQYFRPCNASCDLMDVCNMCDIIRECFSGTNKRSSEIFQQLKSLKSFPSYYNTIVDIFVSDMISKNEATQFIEDLIAHTLNLEARIRKILDGKNGASCEKENKSVTKDCLDIKNNKVKTSNDMSSEDKSKEGNCHKSKLVDQSINEDSTLANTLFKCDKTCFYVTLSSFLSLFSTGTIFGAIFMPCKTQLKQSSWQGSTVQNRVECAMQLSERLELLVTGLMCAFGKIHQGMNLLKSVGAAI